MGYKRLTTDTPCDNFETLMNYCYGKDRIAMLRYAGRCENTPLHEYVATLCKEKGCAADDENITLEDVEEKVCDPMGDCCNCPVGILYYLGCQAVQTRGILKRYEDSGLSPEQVQEFAKAKAEGRLIILPCKIGDTVYSEDALRIGEIEDIGLIISNVTDGMRFSLRVVDKNNGQHLVHKLYSHDIGKTVFFTREAAEKALQTGGDTP